MEQILIAFSSVTYASAGERALLSAGLRARMIRIDASRTRNGCTFGVVTQSSPAKVRRILHSAGIRHAEILKPEHTDL